MKKFSKLNSLISKRDNIYVPGIQGWFSIKKINVNHHINQLKRKSYMMISIVAEKAFYKVQYHLVAKSPRNLAIEKTI